MSRSYRKSPVATENNARKTSAKWWKRTANRRVRYSEDALCGGDYKKAYCSWCICDYRLRMTEREFQREWACENSYPRRKCKTYEQALYWYRKYYRNK